LRFLIDVNIAPQVALALNELGKHPKYPFEVVPHRQKFAANTPDEVWMDALAKEGGWVVITGDLSKKSPQMREAWLRCGLTVFFLASGWTHHIPWEQAWWLVRWWPKILSQTESLEPGTGIEVPARSHGRLAVMPKVPRRK
jgi:hypothetical protein